MAANKRMAGAIAGVCGVVAVGLLSGLMNGGAVRGGTMEQIEAQSNRRRP